MAGVCWQVRSDDERTIRFIRALNHKQTKDCVECERSFLAALDGSCKTPIAGQVLPPRHGDTHTPLRVAVRLRRVQRYASLRRRSVHRTVCASLTQS